MAAPLQTGSEQDPHDDVTNDLNTEYCSKAVRNKWLIDELVSGIKLDSVDDVRTAIEKGAPVNVMYKVNKLVCLNPE